MKPEKTGQQIYNDVMETLLEVSKDMKERNTQAALARAINLRERLEALNRKPDNI